MEKKKTFYITTPIYYPSGKAHIGHSLKDKKGTMFDFKQEQMNMDKKLN